MPPNTKDLILGYLRQSGGKTSVTDIAKKLGLSRLTISKYLAALEAKGLAGFEEVGKAKLYYVKKEESMGGQQPVEEELGEKINAILDAKLEERLGKIGEARQERTAETTAAAEAGHEEDYASVVTEARKLAAIQLLKEGKISLKEAVRVSSVSEEKLQKALEKREKGMAK